MNKILNVQVSDTTDDEQRDEAGIIKKQKMKLSKHIIGEINKAKADVPAKEFFELPEKVLQFGTGVLLRGLPDYFIDKANKQGVFNGRVVVVKSTSAGDSDAFDNQDGLYTLCVSGIENGNEVKEYIVNASISRVLSAKSDWEKVLQCASNPELEIVVSNTTEVGIALQEDDDIRSNPPESFPGKLLALLFERYKAFNGAKDKGLIIIPTELIPDNGTKLEGIVEELAHLNKLDYAFMDWLENCNHFCNSLVDRIVPGKLPAQKQQQVEQQLGYKDELMIMSEVYRLWAIEGDKKIADKLSFAKADEGVIVAENIDKFRELKLRLLNGSHTFSCGLAFLAGFHTVREAMENEGFATFISKLMYEEIIPAIVGGNITDEEAKTFTAAVLDRYRNPNIDHQWLSITMQYSSKMQMRCLPILQKYYQKYNTVPHFMALGVAAHIMFMHTTKDATGKYWGKADDRNYLVTDDKADFCHAKWNSFKNEQLVHEILKDEKHWGFDISSLPGFEKAVAAYLNELQKEGAASLLAKNEPVAIAV
jgi:tagaturonate reductase